MSNEARPLQEREITSSIGIRDRVRGDCHVGGGLRIDGVVRGDVVPSSDHAVLVVGRQAHIDGNIRIYRARIEGHVSGTVTVDGHLDVVAGAVIEGDVHYASLAIQGGGSVTGSLSRMQLDPLRLEE